MSNICISSETCIKCAKCVKVCPALIFQQTEKGEPISVRRAESCIVCGHCVDVCPTGSIQHSDIPKEQIHPIRYDIMPTPEQLMELMRARRSNRTMSDKAVPVEQIDTIVEAARYAPTAKNTRQVRIKAVNDPETLQQIIDYTTETLIEVGMPGAAGLKRACDKGIDTILRKSKAVIAFTTTGDYGAKDGNLAYQNASLMAQALGISQVYLGYVCHAYDAGDKQRLNDILGVEGEIQALMGIGIPTIKYTNYTER